MIDTPFARKAGTGTLAAAILLTFLLLVGGPTPAADARPSAKPASVRLNVATQNQAALLRTGRLKVRVRSSGRARVRLAVRSGGRANLFRKRTIRFRAKGARIVQLPLTARGRARLSRCGAKRVVVRAAVRSRGKKRQARRAKRLARWAKRCAGKAKPVTVPLGEKPEQCDFLDRTVCLQPFPNDYYTRSDPSTLTDRRLNLGPESTPVNSGASHAIRIGHMDVTDINRADGFSPGNLITVKVPGLDTPAAFERSGLVPITDLRRYADPEQAVIVVDAETGERHPVWAELDSNPTAVDPSGDGPGGPDANPGNTAEVNLIIRPARNFANGRRYIVALRNLKDGAGAAIEAPIGFRAYRDKLPTNQPAVEQRRPHMESVINVLTGKSGVKRKSLYMAWDFTVASRESVTGRALQIRDDAFGELGDPVLDDRVIQGASPTWEIDGSETNPEPGILKRITGRITGIPCYLDQDGCPTGSQFAFDPDGKVKRNPAFRANAPFRCDVPSSLVSGSTVTPAQTGTYGHGLLGTLNQVRGQNQYANETDTIWCAMNWDGFSEPDLGTVISALTDLSNFNRIADRMQQGFLNFLYLQRALVHPQGLATDPAFQHDAGDGARPLIDTTAGFHTRGQYMGVSQGGIMGGALVALSPDADRGVLDVPGMNYSTLLRRSVDSDMYFKLPGGGLYANYTELRERPVLLSLIQLLWDRGEANGYAGSLGDDPLPNTPRHDVLLRLAFGDHQVANVSAEVMARTIGAKVYAPALNPGRHWEQDPFMGLDQVTSFPAPAGNSWMVYYDGGPVGYLNTTPQLPGDPSECPRPDPAANPCGGSGTPPNGNVPPRTEWGYGADPHGYPRYARDGIAHGKSFLGNGTIGLCHSGSYCYSNDWDGSNP